MIDVHHRLPVRAALFPAFYLAPQVPREARRLFDAACRSAGLDLDPLERLPDIRGSTIALALSREWGDDAMAARLRDAIDAQFEPTWDRERGEFTWGLGLDEPYPRGQYNAFLATAEATSRGAWARLSEAPLEDGPQVLGVDFPRVALRRARWEGDALDLAIEVLRPDPARTTELRVVGADPARRWMVEPPTRARVAQDGGVVRVEAPLESTALRLRPAS